MSGESRRGVLLLGLAIVALAVTILFVLLRQQGRPPGFQTESVPQAESTLARWDSVFTAPKARVALMTPTPFGAADLRGRAIYDPATRRAVLVFRNFEAPEGKSFALWAIEGARSRHLARIAADQRGVAVLRLEYGGNPDSINAFAVSLEEIGRTTSDAPGGLVVMLGALEE